MSELERYRKKIDEVNDKILKLLSKRVDIVKKVKQYKQKHNIPITDKGREKVIFEKLGKKAEEFDLSKTSYKEIFEAIIRHSKQVQRK